MIKYHKKEKERDKEIETKWNQTANIWGTYKSESFKDVDRSSRPTSPLLPLPPFSDDDGSADVPDESLLPFGAYIVA